METTVKRGMPILRVMRVDGRPSDWYGGVGGMQHSSGQLADARVGNVSHFQWLIFITIAIKRSCLRKWHEQVYENASICCV